jgi:tRNA(Leu) C34 or U34 (ribose-2'-O)-methylase TrmL
MKQVNSVVPELNAMKKYPDPLYFKGDIQLLQRPKVSIVGTRRPSAYTRQYTYDLAKTLEFFKREQASLYTLSSHAKKSYREQQYPDKTIFILGNESEGVSQEIEVLCNETVSIPMNRGVESLNVAVTASLLAFL